MELKPCPHCGSRELMLINTFMGHMTIRCRECGDIGPPGLGEKSAEDLWNTRCSGCIEVNDHCAIDEEESI